MPNDWDDRELLKSAPERPGPTLGNRATGQWLLAALLLTAAAIVAYLAFGNWTSRNTPATAGAPESAPVTEAIQPLGGSAAPVIVPPLDESDAMVRELVEKLSLHPRVAAWLATRGLIRNFTAVVTNIAEGRTPASLVPALRPAAPFTVIEAGANVRLDPKSYQRYAGLAEAVASIDPAGSARLYATLKPRIEEAYRDLGSAEPLFDRTLERAIVLLLRTPVPDDPIALRPRGIGYGFANERLESLTPAQKQLLRMGPQNARTIQRSLREIGLALGIPPERLPAAA